MSISVLVVDQSASQRETLLRLFETRGDYVRTAATASEARMAHSEHSPDVAIISLPLGDAHQSSLPSILLDADPHLGLVILVESGSASVAADSVQRGAICLERPVKLDALVAIADRSATHLRGRAELALRRRGDKSRIPLPAGVDMLIELAARHADAPVLIVGEAGTGKGVVARLVHDLSRKSGAPFLSIPCGSSGQQALEKQIFGSERGASPDAGSAVLGMLEMADTGSVLLESITGLPYETQLLILRFVEEGTFSRSGGTSRLKSGARIMASSVRPLAPAVDSGLFRADLFYRLQVLTIALPPLRERSSDIETLAGALLPAGARLSPSALLALQHHNWPGNVRELENVLWRASLSSRGSTIELRHLPLSAGVPELKPVAEPTPEAPISSIKLAELEKRAILTALETTGGNKMRAAALLGIARSTLHDKLRKL